MGDAADMLLDGTCDEQTGEYIGDAVGYPRTRQRGFYNTMNPKYRKFPKGKKPLRTKTGFPGGQHLIGAVVDIKYRNILYKDKPIKDRITGNKRGTSRYIIIIDNEERKFKFSQLNNIRKL